MIPFLNNVSGKPQTDISNFSGGLNTTTDKSFLLDTQLFYMVNLCYENYPSLTTRQHRTSIAHFLENTDGFASSKILKMFGTSMTRLYTVERGEEYDSLYYYDIQTLNGGRNLIANLSPSSLLETYSIAECKDATKAYIIISNSVGRWSIEDIQNPTPTFTTYSDNYYGILENHKSRLWVAKGNTVTFSELQNYDGFNMELEDTVQEAGQIQITNSKGNITAIKSFDDKLIVMCEFSMHIIYGDSPNSAVNQFSLVDLENDIGCANNDAIDVCNRKLYWLDANATVYEYTGSYLNRVSEPSSDDSYGVNGGISNGAYKTSIKEEWRLSCGKDKVYVALQQDTTRESNKYIYVFEVKNRIWWCESGEVRSMACWKSLGYALLLGKYNNDIQTIGEFYNNYAGTDDTVFNKLTRQCEEKPIEYEFQTKFFLLGGISKKKTLAEMWFQANADAVVYVSDSWTTSNPWTTPVTAEEYLPVGRLRNSNMAHSISSPTRTSHEGYERQRIMIPKMYLQKVNGFSIRIKGSGRGIFYLIEKEWRIK